MTWRYVLRRVAHSLLIIVLATFVSFMLLRLAPGDPARLILGDRASAEQVAQLTAQLGLDQPLFQQYLGFLGGLVRGDLGDSVVSKQPVVESIATALPYTLLLVGATLVVALVVGLPLGILSALRGGAVNGVSQGIALLGQSIPSFWLGMILIAVVSVRWSLMPTSGAGGISHLILPTLALTPFLLGLVIRVSRSSVQTVEQEDYVRTARSKGVGPVGVVFPHIMKNALIPVTTVVALYAAGLIGGAVVVEVVFAWPGIGQLAVNALVVRDYPMVQAIVLVSAIIFVLTNLAVDLFYLVLDPRARYS